MSRRGVVARFLFASVLELLLTSKPHNENLRLAFVPDSCCYDIWETL